MRLDHLLSKEFYLLFFFYWHSWLVGDAGVCVAGCVTAPKVLNPAWMQNGWPAQYVGAARIVLNEKNMWWCIGMLLGVWGNMCCSFWSPWLKDRVFVFLFFGCGGVVCVNCIVDACDFFFVHVLVF